ncbi:MAG TPA: tetratricopeptide repeat protein [Verrucomicrobiae bacterium]
MTVEEKSNVPRARPIILAPWLVVLGALVLYGITLNHWVTLRSLPVVSQITGWNWHPLPLPWRLQPMAPLLFVLTYPVRLLPVALQPICLNALTALWAALTLGLLAASVRLMPHDRMKEQRVREGGEFALLSVRAAFLPALFAVLMLGLQLTFWQNAISASGEMLDLLVFAFLVFCVLRYRISQNDKWLFVMAFVYGLGVTDNWALSLYGYFPWFLFALIWVKGFGFFNLRFIGLMLLCGIAGLSLYLLMPLIGACGAEPKEFGSTFKFLFVEQLRDQYWSFRIVPRYIGFVAWLAAILPLIFAGIRWPSFEGEISAAGNKMTLFMFQMLHVAFLIFPLVIFFDFKYSPSVRMSEAPNSFLTFFYVAALCIGYFSGYFLLICGRKSAQGWQRPGPGKKLFNRAVVGLVWVVSLGAPIALAVQNIPHIEASNSPAVTEFADNVLAGLPKTNAVVLSDDPERLDLLEATYQRHHVPDDNILIETGSLAHREYVRYLTERYPELKKKMTSPDKLPPVVPDRALDIFMFQTGRIHPIYYLHPSFGYYFEEFYLKPRGLVYELKSYPNKSAQPPLATAEDIRDNESYWSKLENGPLKTLPKLIKLDADAADVGTDYSAGLNYWGVDLQKANHLKEAHARFAQAFDVNPDNYFAKINLLYNEQLQKGDHRPIDTSELFYKASMAYNGPTLALRRCGPLDEPDLDLQIGEVLAQGRNFRQATALFQRRLELLPNDPDAELAMAKTYADLGKLAQAKELVDKLRADPKINKWDLERVEAMAYLAATNSPEAERLLVSAVKEDPSDPVRIDTLADFYRRAGYDANNRHKPEQANAYFAASLSNLDLDLKLVSARHVGDDASFAPLLMRKAEVQMMLNSYSNAITTLSKIMEVQPDNATALLNRGVAEQRINQLNAAKDDYKALGKLLPQEPYVIDFHLAEIASLEKNTPDEIFHLKRYLKSAPDGTPDYANLSKRLQTLEGH